MAGAVSFSEMTPTDIANMALSRLGEKAVSDILENTPRAISCRTHYEIVRDSLLRSHPWNFAVGRATLSSTDTPVFGWDYAFTLPSDFLRLSTLNGVQAGRCAADYTIEGGNVLLDTNEAKITYVKRIEDPTLFDPIFTEVLVFRLASAVAMDVTSEPAKRDEMEALAAMRLKSATFVDAGERRAIVAPAVAASRLRPYPYEILDLPVAGTGIQPGEDADVLGSGNAADGYVLTADGAGGAAWEASAGGGGSMTAAEILAALITVDGAGSGLDADLLDGQSAAAFATAAQGTDERVPTAAGLTTKFGTNKATIADGDKFGGLDSAAADAPKHWLFSLVKSTLKTYFDTLYAAAGAYLTSITTSTPTNLTGILKGNGSDIDAAAAGTDYLAPNGNGSGLTALNPTALGTGTGAISLVAGGTNEDVTLTPSGTGRVKIPGGIIEINNAASGVAFYNGATLLFYVNTSNALQFGGNLNPRTDGQVGLGTAPTGSWDGGFNNLHLTSAAGVRWNNDTALTRAAAGVVAAPSLTLAGHFKFTPVAISALPTASASEGLRYEVNDANAPSVGATVASGGSAKCEVRSNGTDWKVLQIF